MEYVIAFILGVMVGVVFSGWLIKLGFDGLMKDERLFFVDRDGEWQPYDPGDM
jgi:hypothetical protein